VGHDEGDGHLLLHILPDSFVQLSKGVPAYTEIHMEGCPMKALLALLLHISLRDDESSPGEFGDLISKECMTEIQGMVNGIRKSQVSRLALLLRLAITFAGERSTDLRDVEALSICVRKALHLPLDPRARSIVLLFVDRLSQMKDTIVENYRIQEGDETVIDKACELLDELKARLHATTQDLDSTPTNEVSTPEAR
jgi:hypothetical protein